MFTDQDVAEARRQMVLAVSVLTFKAATTPSLTARNVMFHAEELLAALDDFQAGREPEQRGEPPSDDDLRQLLDGLDDE